MGFCGLGPERKQGALTRNATHGGCRAAQLTLSMEPMNITVSASYIMPLSFRVTVRHHCTTFTDTMETSKGKSNHAPGARSSAKERATQLDVASGEGWVSQKTEGRTAPTR